MRRFAAALAGRAALGAAFLLVAPAWADCASQQGSRAKYYLARGPSLGEVPHWSARDCGEPCVVTSSLGGLIADFEAEATRIEREGRHLVIAGDCYSACTIAADMLRRSGRVCIGPRAVLYIHQSYVCDGRRLSREPVAYSPDVMAWIDAHGGEPTTGFLRMTAQDARAFFPVCR